MAAFAQGHQFLREREQHLLDQLARLEQELAEGREKCQARGSGELARLALIISELEGKAQQPAAELMQVRTFQGRAGHQGRAQGSRPCPAVACRTVGALAFFSETWAGNPALPTHSSGCLSIKCDCPGLSQHLPGFKEPGEGAVHKRMRETRQEI